jgi:hypothetical protein
MLFCATPTAAETVCATEGWQSSRFHGEVHGASPAEARAGSYVVMLTPNAHGWEIGVRAQDGAAVPVLAPPLRPVETNPAVIAGWHFRNADNTGPNMGDVNAPQAIRNFAFGALAVAALADPDLLSIPAGAAPPQAPPGSGRGQL